MPSALPSTPEDVYGTLNSSSNPCSVPSSPFMPCMTGSTTSHFSTVSSPRFMLLISTFIMPLKPCGAIDDTGISVSLPSSLITGATWLTSCGLNAL